MLCCKAPIVALHGYLGSPADWEAFEVTPLRIPSSIDQIHLPLGSILMGYSMGGRIALELAAKNPSAYRGLILIGVNPGLESKEVAARKKFENHWLQIFKTAPYKKALELWYSQPLFDSLRASSYFEDLLARRLADPSPWQYMETYRLKKLSMPQLPTLYIYGEHDLKYAQIAKHFKNRLMIPGTGHAPHLENPPLFSAQVAYYFGQGNNELSNPSLLQ